MSTPSIEIIFLIPGLHRLAFCKAKMQALSHLRYSAGSKLAAEEKAI